MEEFKKEMPEIKRGYLVGISTQDKLIFEHVGTEDPNLVELLGLHQYAASRIEMIENVNQNYGYPILAQQNLQMQKLLQICINMITQLTKQTEVKE